MRGRLKILLGYNSGVGKSYRMFDEGRRRRERGQDVVVGAVQPRNDVATAALLRQLPRIAMCGGHGATAMDLPALLLRQPEVCLVDGIAYDNPPGAPYAHRWQEIEALLTAGIAVIATVNLQFIAEQGGEVERITGKRPAETVPAEFILNAGEIEIVDTPAVTPAQARLRQLALLFAAGVVERQLEEYLLNHGMPSGSDAAWGTHERILVCVTPWFAAGRMLASAQRNAARFHGDWLAAHVEQFRLPAADRRRLEENLATARAAGGETVELRGEDFVATLLPFARGRGVTQLFVGHSIHRGWRRWLRPSALQRLIRAADGLDVRVFPS